MVTSQEIDTMTSGTGGMVYSKSYIQQMYPKIRVPAEITPKAVETAFHQFQQRQARFTLLENYYKGKHRFPEGSNSMVVSNLCRYITRALKGYLVGLHPQYTCDENDPYAEQIIETFNDQNKWLTDSDLVQDASVFGRAFELVYRDAKDPRKAKSTTVSPKDAFVAYSGDIESDSVFGAVVYTETDENGTNTYRMYLYSAEDLQIWESTGKNGPWSLVDGPIPHGMGRVPLIEYANNKDFMGDFEQIIPLQDAYNQLLSDRLDDKTAFAQAMLKITGSIIGETDEEIEDKLQGFKKRKVIHLDSDSTADYLVKTMDETGVQVYQDQLKNDIHKEAMVPDLSDEQFANNASGVSMAYKLFGTDQMVADKIAQFEKGFRRRCKLYDAVMFNGTASPAYEPRADIGSMNIKFRLNTPQDISYATTAYATAIGAGFLSKRTAMENLSIVDDAQLEQERIDAEMEQQTQAMKAAFEDDYARSDNATFPRDVGDDDASDDEDDRVSR